MIRKCYKCKEEFIEGEDVFGFVMYEYNSDFEFEEYEGESSWESCHLYCWECVKRIDNELETEFREK